MQIQFQMDERKALEAIIWLVQERPGLTRHALSRILYFADKRHLHEYGRPVIGDEYVAMNEGMVPSRVLDMLERDPRNLYPPEIEAVEAGLEEYDNEEGRPAYRARRAPEADYLSRTDLEALDWALREYGDMGFEELREVAHRDPAWKVAFNRPKNHEMDYEDIIDASHPKRDLLLKKLRATSRRIIF